MESPPAVGRQGVKGVTMEDVGLVKGLVLTGFFGMVGFFPLVAVLLVLWAPIAALLCANSAPPAWP